MPGICNPLVPEHQKEKYGTTGKGEKYHQSDFNQKNRLTHAILTLFDLFHLFLFFHVCHTRSPIRGNN